MKSLVSILVPAYNAEHWIADTLRSAVTQSWPHKEIIVVDDGSTDRTLVVARQFESASVRVVSQENQGAAAARNKALSLSQGDYIQWLDADDLLATDKIARQMERSDDDRESRALLSSAFGLFMYRYYRTEFIPTPLWCDLSPVEWLTRKMGQNLYMQTSTWLASRALIEAAGPWNTKLLGDDDGEYFCRVLLQSTEVRFVPEARVYYRMSGSGSLSYIGRSDRKMEAQWHSMRLHIEYLRSLEDSERTRAACVRFLQNWLGNFYPQRPDIVKQAEHLAEELGGRLHMPRLSWKYAWMETLFGWSLAHRMQVLLPAARWSLTRHWDRTLFRVESRRLAGRSES
ncbi:MAG TPA: glycosyltransferase [Terriglobales bacterium]|nr:glycosyltransferase [Terriglobales bacterium]